MNTDFKKGRGEGRGREKGRGEEARGRGETKIKTQVLENRAGRDEVQQVSSAFKLILITNFLIGILTLALLS